MSILPWLEYDVDHALIRQQLQARVNRHVALNEQTSNELKTIYLFLTRKCNLACQHCYIEGVGPARDKDFDLPAIKRLVEQALPHGLKKVKVSGGEPFVRKDALDILHYLDSLGLEIVLETNGTLFKSDTVEQLSKLRNFTIFISLDHLEAERHDEFRGRQGSYDKTVQVLQELGQTAISSVVTTTAMRYNYASILSIVEAVLGWGIKRHRTLLNIHPLGNARGHLDNRITMEEAQSLIAGLLQSPYFSTGRAYMTLPPALMPLEQLRDLHMCGWGNSVLGVLSNGDISMCSASYDDPNMIGGNAFEQDLIDIWSNSAFFTQLRDISNGKVKGVCGNCIFYAACRGVCRMSSYAHYGETDAPYPLCQEVYNRGGFPNYALVDPHKDCRYGSEVIPTRRNDAKNTFIPLMAAGQAPGD